MTTSESEDFESADEDFDTKDNVSKNLSKKVSTSDVTKEHVTGADQSASKEQINEISKCKDSEESSKLKNESLKFTVLKDETDNKTLQVDTKDEIEKIHEQEDTSIPYVPAEDKTQKLIEKPNESSSESKQSQKRREHKKKPKESKIGANKSVGNKKLGSRIKIAVKEEKNSPELEENSTQKQSADSETRNSEDTVEEKIEPKSTENPETVRGQSSGFQVVEKVPIYTSPSGWGWTGWGTSLLSTASASVSTLTSHVSQGINTVLETVEGGLGAPNPEELVRQEQDLSALKIDEIKEPTPPTDTSEESERESNSSLFPFGQIISGVSHLGKIVENTGAKVLSGGLDTLEVIGKKTMEVLQDGDPGLKKKRAMFESEKPNLSEILREAKDVAEEDAKLLEEKQTARKVHFETLFDDYQGLIHLEALEMLSRQCEMKLQASLLHISGSELQQLQSKLQLVRDECLMPDPDDVPEQDDVNLEENLASAFESFPVAVTSDKILKLWSELKATVKKDITEDMEISKKISILHQRAVSSLAQLTSICVEHFHRAGELLLVHEPRNPKSEATHLMQITLAESLIIEELANLYCEALSSLGDAAQPIVTKVFLEASNSSTYIHDAFHLLVPVLQVGVL